MKLVQNFAYWRELLLNVPGYLLVFRIDEDESSELVFANKNWENILGYKPEDLILRSVGDEKIKKQLNEIVDLIARHSRNEIPLEECKSVWQTSVGAEIAFFLNYQAFKTSSSANFHICVSLGMEKIQLLAIPEKQENAPFLIESAVMKTLISRIPDLLETQNSMLIQGEPSVGKSSLIKYILDLPMALRWKKADSIELFEEMLSQETTSTEYCLVLENLHQLPKLKQEQLLNILERVKERDSLCKLLATTKVGIDRLLDEGYFLPELYYKLGAHTLHIPPLRFRKEDVLAFLNQKLALVRNLFQNQNIQFSDEISAYIKKSDWEGNFEGLKQFFEDCLEEINKEESVLNLPARYKLKTGDQSNLFLEELAEIEPFDNVIKKYLEDVLRKTGGKIYGRDGAANLLRLKPTTLQSKLKKLGVK